MKNREPAFLRNAHNVYRTRFYIVKQEMKIRADERDNTQLFSKDTFYFRTAKRDSEYNSVFCEARVFKRQKTSDYYVCQPRIKRTLPKRRNLRAFCQILA